MYSTSLSNTQNFVFLKRALCPFKKAKRHTYWVIQRKKNDFEIKDWFVPRHLYSFFLTQVKVRVSTLLYKPLYTRLVGSHHMYRHTDNSTRLHCSAITLHLR